MSIDLDLRDDGRATITIDRPAVRNALDAAHQDRLDRVLRQLERMDAVRVVVVTGAGDRVFCAGADMKDPGPEGLDYLAARRPAGFGGLSLRTTLLAPVVGRVNGHALGGGFEIVLGCDLAVAAEHATFGLPEALVGRVPLDGGVALITRALGRKLAAEVLLAGRRLDAHEARELGLVNAVVPSDQLDDAVDDLVARLLRGAPLSQRAIKDMILQGDGLGARGAHDLAPESLIRALGSLDGAEGVQAFREKRDPVWSGR